MAPKKHNTKGNNRKITRQMGLTQSLIN